MFQQSRPTSGVASTFNIAQLIYHSVVHSVRKSHGNAIIALLTNMMQGIIFVVAFYIMFSIFGLKSSALRGDFLLFLMSGVFLYLTHVKAVSAVTGAAGPTSAMMLHAPMNTIVSIAAEALGALYIQVLSLFCILFIYHVAITPFEIDQPIAAFGMLLLAWFTGVALGLVLMAINPWFPGFVRVFSNVYRRVNMIASGKMFVVNALPGFMRSIFDWNPLFHIIDQTRGYVFINYFPRFTSVEYPLLIGVGLIVLGMMGEFYTRQYASVSWSARR